MNNRARTSAVVLGLIGGSVNALLAVIALISLFAGIIQLTGSYDATGPILVFVAIFLVCSLNFAGSLVCIRRRIAGGVMMLITAILLLIALIIVLANVSEYYSYGPQIIGLIAIAVFMVEEILSIIGAIICFSSGSAASAPQYGMYGSPNPYQVYGQPQQPYGQPQYGPQNSYQPYGQPSYGVQAQQPYVQPQQPYAPPSAQPYTQPQKPYEEPRQAYSEQPNKTEE